MRSLILSSLVGGVSSREARKMRRKSTVIARFPAAMLGSDHRAGGGRWTRRWKWNPQRRAISVEPARGSASGSRIQFANPGAVPRNLAQFPEFRPLTTAVENARSVRKIRRIPG